MAKGNSFLGFRKKKADTEQVTTELAQVVNPHRVSGIDEGAKQHLRLILEKHLHDEENDLEDDLDALCSLTSEVRAINNQAAILHGERIKKAQGILKSYKEGAFTAWLMATYGNRQTPYNFLQYYDFIETMPETLRSQIEQMPRQAVYSLASREGRIEQKREIVKRYQGETKEELLAIIRDIFPLPETDRRRIDVGEGAVTTLRKLHTLLDKKRTALTSTQKNTVRKMLDELRSLLT